MKPRGWISPRSTPGLNTPRLLAEAGYEWHGDTLNDDLPYLVRFGDRSIVAFPNNTEVKPVIAKLNEEIARIMKTPEATESLPSEGAAPVADTPEQFERFFRGEVEKWGKVIRQAGIQAQ